MCRVWMMVCCMSIQLCRNSARAIHMLPGFPQVLPWWQGSGQYYCRLCFGWGSIAFASRGGQNEIAIAEPVSHFALTTQRILTKFVRGMTFKGTTIDERCNWRWTPTTNQDVNDSMHRGGQLSYVGKDINQRGRHVHASTTLCIFMGARLYLSSNSSSN
jgi:hypothetical protein